MENDITSKLPFICIILVNWNKCRLTLQCLESICLISYPNFHVIVVDNGSIDGSPFKIFRSYPQISLIRNEHNMGFAEGNNVGIRKALEMRADYMFLLNNDTVVDKYVLCALVDKALGGKNIGILGCKIYYYDKPDKIWFAGEDRSPNTGFRKYFGRNRLDGGEYSEVIECNCITGCAMFIPAGVFEKVGFFDKSYFAYSEDVDFCMRVLLKGYSICCVRQAKLWHKISSSLGNNSPIKSYFSIRNRLLTIERYCNEKYSFWILAFQECYLLLVALLKYFIRGRFKVFLAYLHGIYDFRKRRFGKGRYEGKI